jgi:hypothetical protein
MPIVSATHVHTQEQNVGNVQSMVHYALARTLTNNLINGHLTEDYFKRTVSRDYDEIRTTLTMHVMTEERSKAIERLLRDVLSQHTLNAALRTRLLYELNLL